MATDNAIGSLQDSLNLKITPSKVKDSLSHSINLNQESILETLRKMFSDGENMKKVTRNNVRNNLTKAGNASALSLIVKAEEQVKESSDKAKAAGKEVTSLGSADEFNYYKSLLNRYRRRTCMDTAVAYAALVDYTVHQLVEHTKTNALAAGCKFL